jgi:DNA-binding MltR family transcriptional regulator
MENLTIKNHLQELKVSTSRMLVYNSDNPELLSYFKDVTFKLEMIEKLLSVDFVLDWFAIQEAYKSILKQDTELTDVDIRISLKPAIEQKVAKITAKLY